MNLLDLEDKKYKDIEVLGYKFKIKFILPMDKVIISQRRMKLQAGEPVESMTQEDFNFFESIAINDVCIEEQPKELKENKSSINWPSNDLILKVADKIREHTEEIESELKKNKPID